MKCPQCERKLKGKKHIFDYSYKCGIVGTTINTAKKYICASCDKSFIDLGSVDEINKQIAEILLCQIMITRQHLRFIRSEIFDENYFQFAKRTGLNPQYLRDLESFKKPINLEASKAIQLVLAQKYIFKSVKVKVS